MSIKKTSRLILIVFSALIFVQSATVFAIGQMTEPIVFENAIREESFEEMLYIFNTGEKEENFKIIAEGDVKDWAKFYNPEDPKVSVEEVAISQNSRKNLLVVFSIPKGTPNGKYEGVIGVTVSGEKESAEESFTTVGQRIDREVSITVTDEENVSFETTVIPVKYKIGANEPLQIKIIHDNQGNVSVKPDVQLKITRDGQTIFNAIFPYPEDENPTRPLERKTMPLIEWQAVGQEKGRYLAETKILLNGEVKKEGSFSFAISSDLNRFLSFLSRIGGGSLTIGWMIAGGFLLMVSMLFISASKKKGFINIEKIKRIKKIKK